MKQKVQKTTKVIISLALITCLLFVSLIGLTVAYYSDTKNYSGTLDFGYIELDVTGNISGTNLTFTTERKTKSDASWIGNVMPGDTVTLKFNVGLKSDCEPAYYLVRISDSLGFFTTTGIYYSNTSGTIAESTATNKAVGTITKDETHPFEYTQTILTTDESNVGGVDEIKIDICAIQQANLITTEAHEYLYSKFIPYTRSGNIITFGSYPQTYAGTDAAALGIGTTTNASGYYIGTNGTKYAKITTKPYKTDGTYSYSDGTKITATDETAYFKVEPLQWRVIKEENGIATIVCLNVITAMRYSLRLNRYDVSWLRKFLTPTGVEGSGEFYYMAFSTAVRGIIKETEVDNSAVSTGISRNPYYCANTNDYVFALSIVEVTKNNEMWNKALVNFGYKNTDYAYATGAAIAGSLNGVVGGYAWLRSPTNYVNYNTYAMDCRNYINKSCGDNFVGVVPALRICL